MTEYSDGWWTSQDGLRLHYRDYPGDGTRPPLLCLPGLTRNARDFAALARTLSADGWRVLCAEMRGRGLSQYAEDPATYTPYHYVEDVLNLLDQAEVPVVGIIGTSLGGLMAMLLAMHRPERIAGVLFNDIGPVIDTEGLSRIGAYVGAAPQFASWDAAAAYQKNLFGGAFPGRDDASWLASARRRMVQTADGMIRFDYDPGIATPFRTQSNTPAPDLWPGLVALADRPVLLVRGGLSDILSPTVLAEMHRRLPGAEVVTIPGVGHAPALDEAEVQAPIRRWLARLAEGGARP